MRPPRIAILILFSTATLFLLCRSIFSTSRPVAGHASPKSRSRKSVWGFMYYNTPFSLFPPNAAISLTDDNSTSFAARPAAFGPKLLPRGLSGQLWVGSGFAEESLEGQGELGCSDLPGWDIGALALSSKDALQDAGSQAATAADAHSNHPQNGQKLSDQEVRDKVARSRLLPQPVAQPAQPAADDGTDDHLRELSAASTPQKETPQDSTEIDGKIALLMRGGCGFLDKVLWAQRRGAVAVIVGDNQKGGPLIQMFAHGQDVDNVTIPSVFTARTTAHLLSSLTQAGSFIEDSVDSNGNHVFKVSQNNNALEAKKSQPTFRKMKRSTPSQVQASGTAQGRDTKQQEIASGRVNKRLPALGNQDKGFFSGFFTSHRKSKQGETPSMKDLNDRIFDLPFPDSPDDEVREGLWVTITPTSSASPFFDTLLVLVISPLITLTVVYALLIIRSRVRRRRWRAPKSVVDRLPVRTYHTVAPSPSLTPRAPSPRSASPTTPLLQDNSSRPRPRTIAPVEQVEDENLLAPSSAISTPASPSRRTRHEREKGFSAEWKKYMGRQVECVVCLEEYVDGVSRVMSLPCGHEFHVDCITPWLTTRRRTCPICKGDVVRSLARRTSSSPRYEPYHDDSDDDNDESEGEASGSRSTDQDVDVEQGLLSPEPPRQARGRSHNESWLGRFSNNFIGRAPARSRSPEDRRR